MFEKSGVRVVQQVVQTAGGITVRISRHPDKPVLFLLRMASAGMGVWDANWDYLCSYFSVAQFDLKMPPADEMSDTRKLFARLAKDCIDVADDLGFDQFHLLGWTGGAHVALTCAVDFPDRVKSLTLIAPFFRLPDSRSLSIATEFMRVLMQSGNRSLYSYYWFMAGLSPAFVQNRFDEVEQWVQSRLHGDKFMQTDTDRAMLWIEALRSFSLTNEELVNIVVPTLIVGPGLDPAHIGPNAQMSVALGERISNSTVKIASDRGSLMLLEAPEIFRSLSTKFFESLAGA